MNYDDYDYPEATKALLKAHPEWTVAHLDPINNPEEAGEYIIVQDAYIEGVEEAYYVAYGLRVGHEYVTREDVSDDDDWRMGELAYFRIEWDPIKGWEEIEDASCHCDWSRPTYVEYQGAL